MKDIPFKVGVGSLMYIMIGAKAILAFVISTVSQFMLKAKPPHWMAVKRIMRYLKYYLDFKSCLRGKDIV